MAVKSDKFSGFLNKRISKVIEIVQKYWKYSLPVLIPLFIFYFLEFIAMTLQIVQAITLVCLSGVFTSFFLGMGLGVYAYGNTKSGESIRKMRLSNRITPISWGYDLTTWLLGDEDA